MKKFALTAFIVVLAASFIGGCAKGYESQKTVDGVNVKLMIDRYPLVQGDNTLKFAVTDSAGKGITDAKVQVRYYMPPMPGMAPMDYSTQAVLKGDVYSITANISMAGGWKVEVTVTRPGKSSVMAAFNLDAR